MNLHYQQILKQLAKYKKHSSKKLQFLLILELCKFLNINKNIIWYISEMEISRNLNISG